jgi:hypothetical protein
MTQRSGRSTPRQPEGTFDVSVVAIVAFFMRISPLYLTTPTVLLERERIKRTTIKNRRLQHHRKTA